MTNTRDEFADLLWIFGSITTAVFVIIAILVVHHDRSLAARNGRRRLAILVAAGRGVLRGRARGHRGRARHRDVPHRDQGSTPCPARPGLQIDVTAFQWQWRFAYPGGFSADGSREQPAELVVPEDTTVRFTLTARDVVHAFWVPTLRFKRDAFPDHTEEFDLVFPDAGSYTGRCAEFCGLRHANMEFDIVVLPRQQFDAWLAERSTG